MQTAYLHLNRSPDLKRSLGFTYIGLMLIVAIAGIALSGVGIVWKTEMQRENEKELRFAGEQYVAAIASYYECKVCGPQQLPKNLKDLLKDSRAPSVVRHIRKLYRDPMTRSNDWGLIKNGDRIMGVYSKSKLEPLAKPYDLDLFKKKIGTKSGSSVSGNQTNTNQTNLNQVDKNQLGVNQAGANNSNNSVVPNNVAGINRSDNRKADQPIKSKKPSYQDWQFVYGGGDAQALPSSSDVVNNAVSDNNNQNNKSTIKNDIQNSSPNDLEIKKREDNKQFCQKEYDDELLSCQQRKKDGGDSAEYELCTGNADRYFEDCDKRI